MHTRMVQTIFPTSAKWSLRAKDPEKVYIRGIQGNFNDLFHQLKKRVSQTSAVLIFRYMSEISFSFFFFVEVIQPLFGVYSEFLLMTINQYKNRYHKVDVW